MFRVEVELEGALGKYFGQVGMVTKFSAETQEATLVRASGSQILGGGFKIPFSALKPFQESSEGRGLKSMVCDDLTKEAIFLQMGFHDPMSTPDFDTVTQKKPAYIEADQIVMYVALISWTFEDLSVYFYHPQYVLNLIDKVAGEDDEPKEYLPRLREAFQKNLSRYKLHIFPIHSGADSVGESSHWTTLAIDYETQEARYYETLDTPKVYNLSAAQYLCELSEVSMPEDRQNKLRQEGVECGLCTCHYIEQEVRVLAGEGRGSVLGLVRERYLGIRDHLGKMTKVLNAFKKVWLKRKEQEDKHAHAVEALKARAVETAEIKKNEIVKIQQAQAAIGQDFFEGVDMDSVIPKEFTAKKKVGFKASSGLLKKHGSKSKPKDLAESKPKKAKLSDKPASEGEKEEPKAEEEAKAEEEPKVEEEAKAEEEPKVEEEAKAEEEPKPQEEPKPEEEHKVEVAAPASELEVVEPALRGFRGSGPQVYIYIYIFFFLGGCTDRWIRLKICLWIRFKI